MKLFMATLEDKIGYGIPEGSLCSLKGFHNVFSNHYLKSYLSLQRCCDYSEGFIAYLESIDDIECMDDEEIIEAFFDFSLKQQYEEGSHFDTQDCSQHTIASSLLEYEGILHLDNQRESHEMNQQSDKNLFTPFLEINEDIQHPCESLEGKQDNYCFRKIKQRVLPPFTEEEINHILNFQIHIPSIKNDDVIVQSCQFPSDYEVENSDKEEFVLEPLADTNLPQVSENKWSVHEKEFAPDPVDMDTYVVENIMEDTFANLLQPYGNSSYSSPFIDSQKVMLQLVAFCKHWRR